ncbi:MAG: zinc-binding alcohol dehydrogenase family protein [Spirochaetes bacterium]|nr:zinc-binding alcohol dehydrogenase family protein [Spirochaetota bacterium]
MKALVLRQPNEMVLEEVPKPVPQKNEVLVKVLRVGVCGTDLHAYGGNQPFFSYPRIVGHELAVQVVEIPKDVRQQASHVKEGDIVAVLPYLHCGKCIACRRGKTNCCIELQCLGVHTDGGMREYFAIHPKYLVPAGKVSVEDIALVECFSIGFHGVRRSEVKPEETVLVVGAGPIGIGGIHGLKEQGARVIVLDINEKRLEYAKRVARADVTILAGKDSVEQRILEVTGGENPTLVMDATGNAKQMMESFNFVSQGGRLVFVGLVTADITFSDPLFHRKEITLYASRNATFEDFRNVISAMENRRISTEGFITHTASLEEAADQFPLWRNPKTGVIKAVVKVG